MCRPRPKPVFRNSKAVRGSGSLPARTPRTVVDWLHAEAQKAFSAPDVRARFAEQGLAVILGTPEETAAFVAAESKRWGEVIRRANITLE